MKAKINRRDFLKLAATLPLLKLSSSRLTSVMGARAPASRPANVLILVFDALSALNMPVYGYPRQTTPNLARFAEQATVFHANYSAGNFTTPGTASLFTGTYPWSHRALHLHGTVLEGYTQRNFFHLAGPGYYRLGYSHNSLVTSLLHQMRSDLEAFKYPRDLALADLQYSDVVFPEDYNASIWSETLILRSESTFSSSLFFSFISRLIQALRERQLKQEYGKEFPEGLSNNKAVYYILENGIDWLIDQLGNMPQPFLSYIHFLPPHSPYTTRSEFVNRFRDGYVPVAKPRHRFSEKGNTQKFLNQQRRAYDEYLAYADSEFGRLYDHLEQSGLLENTYLIFTSDHGEMFERGIWGHGGRTLYEPLIRVPLLISKPGQTFHEDVRTPTSNVDLLPTLLHTLGQPIPDWCEGQILPSFSEQPAIGERSIFAMEAKQNAQRSPLKIGTFTLIKGSYKLIYYLGYKDYKDDRHELYNLANDPEELDNRYVAEKPLAMELRQELEAKLQEMNQPYLRKNS
jgi:arylsulfatase A-like enzyme